MLHSGETNVNKTIKVKGEKSIPIFFLTVWAALILGCASNRAADMSRSEAKRITDIVIIENSESLTIIIKGNRPLTYTANKQVAPQGVLFQFPDTTLDINKGIYSPPGENIIRSIKAGEVEGEKTTNSRIFIALDRDATYDLTPEKAGIKVSFPKTVPLSKAVKPQKRPEETKPPRAKQTQEASQTPPPIRKEIAAATRLKAVTIKNLADTITVNVEADGMIKVYKSFTMENPARIVLDLHDIKSPYENEQKIAVDSQWLTRIRYYGHPDKLRLVLETREDYLTKYTTRSTDTGLLINIGNITTTSLAADQPDKEIEKGNKRVKLTWDSVPDANYYNVYLSNSPGVSRRNGYKISNVKYPYTVANLKAGATYYFVVTAVNASGESEESKELSFRVGE
jgi:hypothetical protein